MTQPIFPYRVRTRTRPAPLKPSPGEYLSSSSPEEPTTLSEPPQADMDEVAEAPIAATAYTRSRRKDGDYPVGYARPPVATRFQKGQSGNPKGRPKGVKNHRTVLIEKLDTKVSVREGGRQKRISKFEMGATRLANRFAETGDTKIYALIGKVLEPQPGSATAAPASSAEDQPEELSATNRKILDWYVTAMTQPNGHGEPQASQSPQAASDGEGDQL